MTSNVQNALNHYEKNKEKHLQDLIELSRIPSVSFPGHPPEQVQRSAEKVAEIFKRIGLENVQVLRLNDKVHPYVYADWLHAKDKPTLLLYAHHDVQPSGRDEIWKSPAFQPTLRDGRLFGRGTADDKAGVIVHSAAIESYLKTAGELPVNVKLLIEGEEETGSENLAEFVRKYRHLLKCDAMVLTDTQNYAEGIPSLTVSLRGIVTVDVELRSLNSPKHSGLWGGCLPDPVGALTKILATLTDAEGRIQVPGLWEQVRKLSEKDEKDLEKMPFDLGEFRSQADVVPSARLLPGRDGSVNPLKQNWYEPSIAINAFEASTRKGAANIICDKAWAKVGLRIVPNMDPQKTADLVVEYLKRQVPWGLEAKFETTVSSPWSTKTDHPLFEAAKVALKKGYDQDVILMGCGATIPFVDPLSKELGGVPAILVGVEDPLTNAHSENESLLLSEFEKCTKAEIHLFEEAAKARI